MSGWRHDVPRTDPPDTDAPVGTAPPNSEDVMTRDYAAEMRARLTLAGLRPLRGNALGTHVMTDPYPGQPTPTSPGNPSQPSGPKGAS